MRQGLGRRVKDKGCGTPNTEGHVKPYGRLLLVNAF